MSLTWDDAKDKVLIAMLGIGITLLWNMSSRQEKATEAVVNLSGEFKAFTVEMRNLKDQQSKAEVALAKADTKNSEQDKTLVDHERRIVYIERRRN